MESSPQQTSEGKAVVAVLAAVLDRLVNSNAHVPSGENVTKFHALKAPAISIKQYLERVSQKIASSHNVVDFDWRAPKIALVIILLACHFDWRAVDMRTFLSLTRKILTSKTCPSLFPSFFQRYTSTHLALRNALSWHSST